MPSRFGQVWSSTVEAASVAAGDVYFLAGPEEGVQTLLSTGVVSPTAAVNVASVGTSWTNPGNVYVYDDANEATVTLEANTPSKPLRASGYGFSIPEDSTSIVAKIYINVTTNTADHVLNAQLLDAGDNQYGTINTLPLGVTSTSFTLGDTLTASVVNNDGFGYQVSFNSSASTGNGAVDYMGLTLDYYTAVYSSLPLLLRVLSADIGFLNAAGSGETEDAYIPVDVIVGDYNGPTSLTLVGTTSPVVTNSVTATKPQLYKGAYSQVVSAQVKKRVYVNPRYPLNLDMLGLEKFTGNNGTTRKSGADIPFVGLHFPTAVSKAMKLTLLSEG